jgi:hypothetical protein
MRVQFFDAGQGSFFADTEVNSDNPDGQFAEGDQVPLVLSFDNGSTDVEVAVALLDPNGVPRATRRLPVTITAGRRAVLEVDLLDPVCGDGFIDTSRFGQETCDDAGTPDGCPDTCRFGRCGDGVRDRVLEQCDLGDDQNGTLGSACSTSCQLDAALLFGGRVVPVPSSPVRVAGLRSGSNGALELAAFDTAGGALLAPIVGGLTAPLGASVPLSVFARVDSLAAADLDADSSPELVALHRTQHRVDIATRPGGALALANSLSLVDPVDGSLLEIAELGLSSGAAPALFLAETNELWRAPAAGLGFALATAERAPLPSAPRGLLVADVDGDSTEDVAVRLAQQVVLFRGGEPLSAGPAAVFDCGEDGASAELIDLDVLSLGSARGLLATRADGRICAFEFGGSGFVLRQQVAARAESAVVFGGAQQGEVLLSSGEGQSQVLSLVDFASPAVLGERIGLLNTAGGLAAADLDGDGAEDLIAASPGASALHLFLRDPSGTLSAPRISAPLSGAVLATALVDLDRDGSLDLAAASPGEISVFSGPLSSFETPALFSGPSNAHAVRALDRDFDGNPDLAIPTGQTLRFLLGDGAGGFSSEEDFSPGASFGPIDFAQGEIDTEAGIDWAILYDDLDGASARDGGLLFFRNVGATPGAFEDVGLGALGAVQVEARDLDFNRRRDLAITLPDANQIALVRVNNAGVAENFTIQIQEPCAPFAVLTLNTDQDVFEDGVAFCSEDGSLLLFLDVAIASPDPDVFPFLGAAVRAVSVGDLNRDGVSDVAAFSARGELGIMLTAGQPSSTEPVEFSAPLLLPGAVLPSSLTAATIQGRVGLVFGDASGVVGVWNPVP